MAEKQQQRRVLPGSTIGRRVGLLGFSLLSLVVLSGCSSATKADWKRAGMPEPSTEQADRVLSFWTGSWIALMAVGIFVWGLMIWAFIVYRHRKGAAVPVQTRYNMPIEALWTIAPLIMIIGFFYFTQRDTAILTKVTSDNTQTVNVTGFRWSWTFNYVNQDVFETGQPAYQINEKDNGPVPTQEAGIPTLWLPIGQEVRFNLSSPDVVHSFWVPVFLTKLDVVPGRTNTFEVTPNRLGTFAGKCAELCGVDHSRMLFNVKVVTQAEFDAHINELRQRGLTGQLNTGRTSDQAQKV